jgi:hypothetical protein
MSTFTLSELGAASDEQLQKWFSEFTGQPLEQVARRRRTALLAALRNAAKEDTAASPARKVEKRVREKAEVVAAAPAPEVEASFATLKLVAAKHDVKGRSKALLVAALKEKGVDVAAEAAALEAQEQGEPEEDEEDEKPKPKPKKKQSAKRKKNDDDDDFAEEPEEEAEGEAEADSSFNGSEEGGQRKKSKGKGKKGKAKKKKKSKSDVPFTATQLLCATMAELRQFAAEVGAESKRKEDLLRELRDMLPEDEQWATSEDNWENTTLPGTNEYGNIDVREGVAKGLVHVSGLRLGPTARAHHIPCCAAVVGFSEYRGRYSPITDGIVIRKKDLIKLQGFLALKDVKGDRKIEREERKLMTPKVSPPWTFDQLPEDQRGNLRDFSLLPRDNW